MKDIQRIGYFQMKCFRIGNQILLRPRSGVRKYTCSGGSRNFKRGGGGPGAPVLDPPLTCIATSYGRGSDILTVMCDGDNLATCLFFKFKFRQEKCQTFLRPVYREPICVSVWTSHIELIRYDDKQRADKRLSRGPWATSLTWENSYNQ